MNYRPLGATGFSASLFGLGGESALYKRSEQAQRIIRRALDLGVNYFDTAPLYADSELNYGDVFSDRLLRAQAFVATKTDRRDYDGAWRQFEESLRRLRTDYVDLLQVHHLDAADEVSAILDPESGAVRMVQEAKDQGLARFIGVTGHTDPDVLLAAIEAHPFDNILLALNPADVHRASFQERLLPRALGLGMGVAAMKVFARGRLFQVPGMDAGAALGYVFSLPVSTAVVGVMNEAQLERCAAVAANFRAPFSEEELQAMEQAAASAEESVNFYRKGSEAPIPGFDEMPTEVL